MGRISLRVRSDVRSPADFAYPSVLSPHHPQPLTLPRINKLGSRCRAQRKAVSLLEKPACRVKGPSHRRRLIEGSQYAVARGRLHGERGRGQAREEADRRAPVRAPLALAGRAAARSGAKRVPEDALLGRVRRLASRPYLGRGRGDEETLRVCLWRPSPAAPDRADRLPLPRGGVAAQGDRACSTRAPAVPRPKDSPMIAQ